MNNKLFKEFMTEKVAVHVKTQNECNQFMELLENETCIRWGSGTRPRRWNLWDVNHENTVIDSNYGKSLTYDDAEYYEYLGYKIIEFSDLIKEENNMKFKVGDKVRVRSWENMEKEFGLNKWGELNCPTPFTKDMKEYCGTVQTVGGISYGTYYVLKSISGWYFSGDMLEPIKQETGKIM